ncbi:hypothetical protein MAR_020739 [Mya arenaria]|uniref:Uncharacterized protein n=1 Tax=Mya arenaria TaxID=6604 RepID=A0ABY7E676_MYAAR|nr:hypothetical protein MAR_020739 [Mya arenaria]
MTTGKLQANASLDVFYESILCNGIEKNAVADSDIVLKYRQRSLVQCHVADKRVGNEGEHLITREHHEKH